MRNLTRNRLRSVLFVLALGFALPVMGGESEVYGSDPLRPADDSLIGLYLRESGAYSLARPFPESQGGPLGSSRLVVTVSEKSFPVLARYFSGKKFLYLYHEANQRLLTAAFDGRRGTMGRLDREFKFIAPGTLLLPMHLTPAESDRAAKFFELAENCKRKFDAALFPWLLKDAAGTAYCATGNQSSLADWFVRMPIGEELDLGEVHPEYEVDRLKPVAQALVREVWTTPHAHQSLAQVMGLKRFNPNRELDTPGLIGSSMLANMSDERLPVVFRFVADHTVPLDADFNTWLDVEFNPDRQ